MFEAATATVVPFGSMERGASISIIPLGEYSVYAPASVEKIVSTSVDYINLHHVASSKPM